MKVHLKLARVGMNMESATIAKWHKALGDDFVEGEPLYDIETEKVTQEVPAPGNGKLIEIRVAEGDEAEVGDTICVVEGA